MTSTLNPSLLILIPLAPLIGSIIAGFFGTKFLGNILSRTNCHRITILGVAVAVAYQFMF